MLVLLALADAADDVGIVRASRQHIADRARVTTSTAYAAMAMLFKSGELLRYDAEAPDPALCIVACSRGRDKSEACDIPNSGIRKFEADDAGNEFSDLQNLDDMNAETEEDFEDDPEEPLEDFLSAFVRGGTPPTEPIEAVQIAPPPAPRRMVPKHLPPGDLGLVLAALGVEGDMRGPLLWYRREHRAELDFFLDQMPRTTADNLALMITERRIGAPDLDRVASILKLVSKRV